MQRRDSDETPPKGFLPSRASSYPHGGQGGNAERGNGDAPTGAPFGPFRVQHEKPYSRTYTNESGTAFLKEYRGVVPSKRQEREVLAMAKARRFGVAVPEVLAAGSAESSTWTVFRKLPGLAGTVATPERLSVFVDQVLALGRRIHSVSPGTPPGVGWDPSADDERTHQGFLMGQFSPRARFQPWWDRLGDALGFLALGPVVYLHGDLKAEHFLVDGDHVSVVDWEACARGPAAYDHADALFHVLRDLLYSRTEVRRLPHESIGRLCAPGPVMALRLLLWLDRRAPRGPDALSARSLDRLMTAEPTDVSRFAALVIAEALDRGVPR